MLSLLLNSTLITGYRIHDDLSNFHTQYFCFRNTLIYYLIILFQIGNLMKIDVIEDEYVEF